MAEIRYVVLDYSDEDYFEVGSSIGYFEFEYVTAGYVSSVINGTADLTAVFSQSTIPGLIFGVNSNLNTQTQLSALAVKVFGVNSNLNTQTQLSAAAVKVFGADAQLSATSTITAVALQIIPAVLTLTDGVTLTSNGNAIRSAELNITATSNLTSQAAVIRAGAVDLNAFNSIVTAALRIKPAADLSDIVFSLSATAYDFTKATAALTEEFTTSPIGGKIFGGIIQGQSPIPYPTLDWDTAIYGTLASENDVTIDALGSGALGGKVFAFWADAGNGGGNIVTQIAGIPITIFEDSDYFNISLSNGLLSITGQSNTRSWYVPTTGWHHYLINMQYSGGEIRTYVDGIQVSQTNNSTTPIVALITNNLNVADSFQGSLAQFWLGRTVLNELTYWYDAGFVDMGTTGITDNRTTGEQPYQTVYYYDRIGYNLTDIVKRSASTDGVLDWRADDIYRNIPTIVATLTARGDNIVVGEVTVNAQASLSAELGYVKVAQANLSASATTNIDAYDFTKGTADLTSIFTLTADTDEISSGEVLGPVAFSLSASAGTTKLASSSSDIVASLDAVGNTNQLASASLQTEFTLAVSAYDFTKAQAQLAIIAALAAEGRLQDRERGNLLSGMVFDLAATALRIRPGLATITTAANLVPNAVVRRSGIVSMSAFDTVLSAGKIIEFLAENTIQVTQEQRLLKVALESTLLLVEMANGVNIVMAESTDTKVAQEQGLLLAQYNTPN